MKEILSIKRKKKIKILKKIKKIFIKLKKLKLWSKKEYSMI